MRVEIGKKRKLIQVGAKNRGELSCSCIVIAMQTCNAAHHALCIGTSPDLPHLVILIYFPAQNTPQMGLLRQA